MRPVTYMNSPTLSLTSWRGRRFDPSTLLPLAIALLIAYLTLVPVISMVIDSFHDMDGAFSLHHYTSILSSGTAYPILHRLEDEGWLESRVEQIDPRTEGRPRRRIYQLTGIGEVEAKTLLEARRDSKQRQSHLLPRRREATA